MTATRAIIANVVRSSFRNRTALIFTIGIAFFFMIVFGLVFGGGQRVRVGVVDNDGSATSRAYIAALSAVDGLNVETGSATDEQQRLRDDKIAVLLSIDPGFGQLRPGNTVSVSESTNRDEPEPASIASGVVANVTAGFAARQSQGTASAIALRQATVGTNDITAIDAVLPAMIAYLVLQSGINFVAIGLVDQRQRKVLRRFLATPVRPAQILSGNVVGGGVTVLIQVAVLVACGLLIFHAKTHGSWLLALLVIIVGTAAFVSIGFLICSIARTSESARGLATAIALPMAFLSGVFIPIDVLPQTLQNVVHALPLVYLTDALHGILNDGDGLTRTIAIDIGVLAAWAIVCFSLAASRFRWE